jgi:hypothetical protein
VTIDRSGAAFAVDRGTATFAAAIVGPVGRTRRLLAATQAPASADPEAVLALLIERLRAGDAELAARLGADDGALARWPRLETGSRPEPTLAVLATTERERAAVEALAGRAGWRTLGASLEGDDAIGLTRAGLDRAVVVIAAAAPEPASSEDRATIARLALVAGAIAERDPGVPIVLLGPLGDLAGDFRTPDGEGPLIAPGPTAGEPPGSGLRRVLDALHPGADDGRHAIVRAAIDLAAVLDRRVEVVEIGFNGGLRVLAGPDGPEGEPAIVGEAGLVPGELDDVLVDGVLAWSSIPLDRYRMRDRLRELRIAPWGEAHGAGALIRHAAARAALERLVAATPAISARPAPDLIVLVGGAWAVAPGPALALAVADTVRRPGVSQLAWDHARLLGPIGAVADEAERRALLAELADDLLAPLGSVVVPRGLRTGRSAGRLSVRGDAGTSELDLVPGGLQLVDLPPGQLATAELSFRDQVDLGIRGRQFRLEVGGGLGGLLVDLRDVPLRLPERADRRRALLAAWQGALWAGIES